MGNPTTPARKTVIITGGSIGLGFHAARHIAGHYPGWHIIIANRTASAAQDAIAKIKAQSPNASIEAMTLDLGSLTSVRAFAAQLIARQLPPIHALVCNAGLQLVSDQRSADGYELTFAINHLGHYLLTQLLLPHMAAPARIINVSSGTHFASAEAGADKGGMPDPGYTTAQDAACPPPASGDPQFIGRQRYSTSKLCNVWHTYELVRRLEHSNGSLPQPITVNAFDPGLMPGTGLARDYAPPVRWIWENVLPRVPALTRMMFGAAPMSVSVSGANLARLAVDPAWAGVTGKYVQGDKAVPSSPASYDEAKAHELWESSKGLVRLTAAETAIA
ncbi:MAG: SDR family NAD(P)-dependent oxidoreductase [Chloroflexota bacterium]|nr:SDR family NAD(P)-dependent oxidoreductase [Chloroflexota bacterium]